MRSSDFEAKRDLVLFLAGFRSPLRRFSISSLISMFAVACIWECVLPDMQHVPVVVELERSSCVISSLKSSGMIATWGAMEKHSENIPLFLQQL